MIVLAELMEIHDNYWRSRRSALDSDPPLPSIDYPIDPDSIPRVDPDQAGIDAQEAEMRNQKWLRRIEDPLEQVILKVMLEGVTKKRDILDRREVVERLENSRRQISQIIRHVARKIIRWHIEDDYTSEYDTSAFKTKVDEYKKKVERSMNRFSIDNYVEETNNWIDKSHAYQKRVIRESQDRIRTETRRLDSSYREIFRRFSRIFDRNRNQQRRIRIRYIRDLTMTWITKNECQRKEEKRYIESGKDIIKIKHSIFMRYVELIIMYSMIKDIKNNEDFIPLHFTSVVIMYIKSFERQDEFIMEYVRDIAPHLFKNENNHNDNIIIGSLIDKIKEEFRHVPDFKNIINEYRNIMFDAVTNSVYGRVKLPEFTEEREYYAFITTLFHDNPTGMPFVNAMSAQGPCFQSSSERCTP